MNASSLTKFLYFLGKLPPNAFDAIFPHGPRVSVASRELFIAIALKGLARDITSKPVVAKLANIQKKLVTFAGERLAGSFEIDDWCGTRWPKKWPPPPPVGGPSPEPWLQFDAVALNPQPLPPGELQKWVGGHVLMLSEATSIKDVGAELNTIGNSLLKG